MISRKRWLRDIIIVITVISALLAAVVVLYVAIDVPSVESISERQISQSTKIYDRTGEVLLWEFHNGERRTYIPLGEIDIDIRNATVAIEDDTFYSHNGFNISSIFRALVIDILAGDLAQGGSTITQQLVKSALLVPDKKITRKIKEVVISIKLEKVYSKDKILELYINEIPYGGITYGVESASQTFFGKPATDVSLAEAAYLAAIPNAPTRYSPYGSHVDELESRKNTVLTRMEQLGYITKEQKDAALSEDVKFLPLNKTGIIAPHFVMYVREQLGEMFGEENVERLGLTVITTLDVPLQQHGESLIKKFGDSSRVENDTSNAALVAINPDTGGIMTMIGSRDFFDLEHEGNFNVALAHRQPGSALKPIVYAAAFSEGYTPETVVFDLPTDFAPRSDEEYRPSNFDNKFRGPLTLRSALAQSLNVPAVKVLYLAGMNNVLTLARKMGITSLDDPSRYGLSLVLGGGEVSPLELTGAYAVFASGGIYHPTHSIDRILNQQEEELFVHKDKPERAVNERVVSAISSILSDTNARFPVFAVNSPINFPGRPVAAKTGTTNDYRDAWTVGYTSEIAVGAWIGNNDNSPMENQIASYVVAPLWRAFMDEAIRRFPYDPFPAYEKSSSQKPVLNGQWLGSLVQSDENGSFIETNVHEILHWVDRNNPDGAIPLFPSTDPQYIGWDAPVRAWASGRALPQTTPYFLTNSSNITEISTLPIEFTNTLIRIPFSTNPQTPLASVDIFIDGDFYRKDSNPLNNIIIPNSALEGQFSHQIRLRFITTQGEQVIKDLSTLSTENESL